MKTLIYFFKKASLSVGVIALVLTSCKPTPNREAEKEKLLSRPSPDGAPYIRKKIKKSIDDDIPKLALNHISLSVTDDMPLRPVLVELANQAKMGLRISGDLASKRVTFTARDRPLYEVVEDLCQQAGMRATWRPSALHVEPDESYAHNYSVQFLNMTRSSEHHVSTSTDVFANNTTAPYQGDNGSNSDVRNKGETDFWEELDRNLNLILGDKGAYTIHRQAGIVSISGKWQEHRRVKGYLDKLRTAVRSQVLIEAKIIEVILKDEYKSCVNWKKIKGTDLKLDLPLGAQAADMQGLKSGPSFLQLGIAGQSFETILNALDQFGVMRTLSSPRITVMNNHTAILKVAKNQVYFKLRYDKRYRLQAQQEDVAVSSDIQTVPIGLVLAVHPSIDADNDEVILFLRPTISRLNDSVRDPAIDIAMQNTDNKQPGVPVVEVKEIDSVLRTKSGEVAVLGGLMEVRTTDELSQVPGLGELPLLKEILSGRSDTTHVVELVIVLKVTISDAEPDDIDSRLASSMKDPRSFY